jgi:hypothetical protein
MPDNSHNTLGAQDNLLTRRNFGALLASAALAGELAGAQAASEPRISLAVVGLAHPHLSSFLAAIANRSNMKVAAVWDELPAAAEPIARQTGAKVAKDPEEIWRDPSISAAVVCSPTSKHMDLVLGAATARKHMYVEKPPWRRRCRCGGNGASHREGGGFVSNGLCISQRGGTSVSA